MTLLQQGGCRCGSARFEVNLASSRTLNCHCVDCQKHLGAAFSTFTVVPREEFRWLKKPAGSIAFGQTANRIFCRECGTYLKWEGIGFENEAEINTMTLDDPSALTVDKEIFVRSRLPWITPLEGVPQFDAS